MTYFMFKILFGLYSVYFFPCYQITYKVRGPSILEEFNVDFEWIRLEKKSECLEFPEGWESMHIWLAGEKGTVMCFMGIHCFDAYKCIHLSGKESSDKYVG